MLKQLIVQVMRRYLGHAAAKLTKLYVIADVQLLTSTHVHGQEAQAQEVVVMMLEEAAIQVHAVQLPRVLLHHQHPLRQLQQQCLVQNAQVAGCYVLLNKNAVPHSHIMAIALQIARAR